MSKARQRDFFTKQTDYAPRRSSLGGETSKGHRKLRRPLDRKRPIHLVLKSSHAKGALSMLSRRNRLEVKRIFQQRARQFGVTIHGFENMGNHIHAALTFRRKEEFQNFLRTVSALIARHVTGARKGNPFGKRFWDHLAFTRVVTGLRSWKGLLGYLKKNQIEREGGQAARKAIEAYERATAKARRTGRDVWEILVAESAVAS